VEEAETGPAVTRRSTGTGRLDKTIPAARKPAIFDNWVTAHPKPHARHAFRHNQIATEPAIKKLVAGSPLGEKSSPSAICDFRQSRRWGENLAPPSSWNSDYFFRAPFQKKNKRRGPCGPRPFTRERVRAL